MVLFQNCVSWTGLTVYTQFCVYTKVEETPVIMSVLSLYEKRKTMKRGMQLAYSSAPHYPRFQRYSHKNHLFWNQ
jgi:hypothetical protein